MNFKLKIHSLAVSPAQVKVIGVSICAGLSVLVLAIIGVSYAQYHKVMQRYQRKYSQLIALEKDSQELQRLLHEYMVAREEFESHLFSEQDIAAFLDKVSEFSRNYRVKIADMRASEFVVVAVAQGEAAGQKSYDKKEEGLAYKAIRMEVEADFANLMKFLIALEKTRAKQFLTLTDVSINRSNYPSLKCKFTLKLYGLRDKERLKS